jgi:hypothetical protein
MSGNDLKDGEGEAIFSVASPFKKNKRNEKQPNETRSDGCLFSPF